MSEPLPPVAELSVCTSEKENVNTTGIGVNYNNEFPLLLTPSLSPISPGAWSRPIPSSTVKQTIHIPFGERSGEPEYSFGEKSLEQYKCNGIAKETNSEIELSRNKDMSLTFIVTGKPQAVEEARKKIALEFRLKTAREILIPKDHHRMIVGKEGKKLQELERETGCTIRIPGKENASGMIQVSGSKEGVQEVMQKIQLISDEKARHAQEMLSVPKIYYPWIRGVNNSTVDRLAEENNVRIKIPPPMVSSEMILVSGDKEGVNKAIATIRRIYEEKKKTVKVVTCKVPKEQHRFVVGQQGSGIADVFDKTGVSVEIPSSDSDDITLRGPPEMLGNALSMVYHKASSVVRGEVKCPPWLHKFIIGPGGSNIRQIVDDKPKLNVNFNDDGTICLEGPQEEVQIVEETLRQLTETLQEDMAFEVLHVNPEFHPHLIGKQGAFINKLKEATGVRLIIPEVSTKSDEIRIEGTREGVLRAVEAVMEKVEIAMRMKEREGIVRDEVDVTEKWHSHFIARGASVLREVEQSVGGKVSISFPKVGSKVSFRGAKDNVEAAKKRIVEIVADLELKNHMQKMKVPPEMHSKIVGLRGRTIFGLRSECEVEIRLPGGRPGSEFRKPRPMDLVELAEDEVLIVGYAKNVRKCMDEIQKIVGPSNA